MSCQCNMTTVAVNARIARFPDYPTKTLWIERIYIVLLNETSKQQELT